MKKKFVFITIVLALGILFGFTTVSNALKVEPQKIEATIGDEGVLKSVITEELLKDKKSNF